MEKKSTIFCDIDGTLLKYRKFNTYTTVKAEPIQSTVNFLREQHLKGHMVVLTTARPDEMLEHTLQELKECNIPFDKIITGLERGPRYLINDMEPLQEEKRAIAINLVRDEGFN